MIKSVELIKTPQFNFNYLNEPKQLGLKTKLMKGIFFEKGINIVVGENGCGKSTILNIIREMSLLRHSFFTENFEIGDFEKLKEMYDCFDIKQNYNLPVFNLYRMIDDRFAGENTLLKNKAKVTQLLGCKSESTGMNLMGDISQLFHYMFKEQITDTIKEKLENFPRKDECDILDKIKENNIEDEQITILMDEPDKGLDIDNLNEIYEILSTDRPDSQLICVLHNPLLIYKLSKLDYIHFVEFSENYLDKIIKFIGK